MGPKFINSENFGRNFSNNQARHDEIGNSDWAHALGTCCPRLDPKLHWTLKKKKGKKESNIAMVLIS
jgi:hypothetical protein